jgi:5'-3' exonuclease
MISKGKPFETIGMIDVLIQNLQDTKEEVIAELTQKNNTKTVSKISNQIENALNSLPKHVRDKVIDIKTRLDKAFEEQDEEALAKLKIELEQLKLDELGPDDDDSNFNITDFKGGLA